MRTRWWQFWKPESGVFGIVLFASFMFAVMWGVLDLLGMAP